MYTKVSEFVQAELQANPQMKLEAVYGLLKRWGFDGNGARSMAARTFNKFHRNNPADAGEQATTVVPDTKPLAITRDDITALHDWLATQKPEQLTTLFTLIDRLGHLRFKHLARVLTGDPVLEQ